VKRWFIFAALLSVPAFAGAEPSRKDMLKEDLQQSPPLWKETFKNFVQPKGLWIIGGTAGATILVAQYQGEITREFQRHDNWKDYTSVGDTYGAVLSRVYPQAITYGVGVGFKNQTIREFGRLTTHAGIINGLFTSGLKLMVGADRPGETNTSRLKSSFPSGHASGTAALAGVVQGRYGTGPAIPFHLASIYSGLTRVVDNQHRPQEVVFGWGLGYLVGFSVSWADRRLASENSTLSWEPHFDLEGNRMLIVRKRFGGGKTF